MHRANTSLARWGTSLAVRIPKGMLEEAHLQAGDELEIEVHDRMIIIQPVAGKPTLEELLDGITLENCHPETETGGPVGNEAW